MNAKAESSFALIEEVRKHPILYTNASRYENKRIEHIAAWQEVSKSLGAGTNYTKFRERWRYLRNEQGRFLRSGRLIQIPGIHERLSFLNPYLKPRPKSEGKEVKFEDSLQYAIQLVNCVRQYPCLYNGSNASATESAWKEVAKKLGGGRGANVRGCLFRWKKMHYSYTYYLKKGCIAKPEGIAPYLAFLKPFVELEAVEDEEFIVAKQLANYVRRYPALYDGSQSVHNIALWKEVAQLMGGKLSSESCITKWTRLRTKYEQHLKTGNKMVPYGIDCHLAFLDAFIEVIPATVRSVKHLQVDKTDPDARFLLDFLDSMAKMGEPQKRLFRIGAVKASRVVLDGY